MLLHPTGYYHIPQLFLRRNTTTAGGNVKDNHGRSFPNNGFTYLRYAFYDLLTGIREFSTSETFPLTSL